MSNLITLAKFTTLGIGGDALVDVVHSACELSKCSNSVVLGMGSNVLISDNGIKDRVIINRANGFKIENGVLYAESGCSISHLSTYCSSLGFSGLEWAYMLPATVGGAIVMNAGAFGGQISDSVLKVGVLRLGKVEEIDAKDCGFSYRASKFLEQDIILYAYFALKKESCKSCNKMLEEIRARRNTQPKGKSAGCIYKTEDKSAGWYIEQAGLKNKRVGDIYVSPIHAGFFINAGKGCAKDMLKLMDYVEKTVEDKFNKRLIREIKLIGEF
jgi:UDP-N-acetylmuramate dehydrogenase